MKLSAVLMVCLATVALLQVSEALPSASYGAPVHIPILQDDRSQDSYGGYSFQYKTGNGIERTENGRQNYGQNSDGSWSYTSPEGVKVQISFVADQGGYQPQGAVIPTQPSLPYSRSQQY